jgi:hypothetical protein
MNRNVILRGVRAAVLSSLLLGGLNGCGGGSSAPPIVPIANPSFEVLGGNPDGFQPEAWIREGINDWSATGYGVRRKTAVGFMPSDGQYFLEFPASDAGASLFPGHFPLLKAYQDDVNLSKSTSLRFDYEIATRSILAGSGALGHDGSALVRILFQPNTGGGGTVVLWSKNFGPGTAGEQVTGLSVPLSGLSVPGRLIIEVSAAGSKQGDIISLSTLTFRIDRLSAQ